MPGPSTAVILLGGGGALCVVCACVYHAAGHLSSPFPLTGTNPITSTCDNHRINTLLYLDTVMCWMFCITVLACLSQRTSTVASTCLRLEPPALQTRFVSRIHSDVNSQGSDLGSLISRGSCKNELHFFATFDGIGSDHRDGDNHANDHNAGHHCEQSQTEGQSVSV